ncbi:MAG: helix-turn-helix transcriptional regulator [Arcobacteraceae bacterium]|jgi:transcriptional regulator with XRE-family HTH domain|nr:helix-turn-helix domain-containing protein [Bacteroidales bacterium]MDD2640579.1 helix-turn-helix transcriptional regulator [Arcobacteraceae bacterium]
MTISFGKKLTECRKAKGLSQAKLAKQLGVHHTIIGRYERDEVKPTIDIVKKIAAELDTTVGYLLGETDKQNVLKDPKMLKRIQDIENLPTKDRESLLLTIDNFIKATKLGLLL